MVILQKSIKQLNTKYKKKVIWYKKYFLVHTMYKDKNNYTYKVSTQP